MRPISDEDAEDIKRGRRGEPSSSITLAAWPASDAIHEGKIYKVSIARCDGKHLTTDDYNWVRSRLGMVTDAEPLDAQTGR